GPIVTDPDRLIGEYLAHRRERHQEILAALHAGCRTPAEIVARVYPKLPPGLVPAAEDTVLGHLRAIEDSERRQPSTAATSRCQKSHRREPPRTQISMLV